MSDARSVGVVVGSPPEWWERVVARRVAWLLAHARLLRALRWVPLAGLLLAAGYLVVLSRLVPVTAWSMGAWLGAFWACLCWFVLARTKALAWSTLARWFSVCVLWSPLVGIASRWVMLRAGVNPDNSTMGALIAAPVVEELGKVVPLAVAAVLVPGRVRRFAVADWLVLGMASGLAYTCMEEGLRRLVIFGLPPAPLDLCGFRQGADRLSCAGLPTFGWWPFATGFGGPAQFASHGVMTALVAVGAGIAIRAARSATLRRAAGRWRHAVWCVPAWMLWVVLVTHAATNGTVRGGTGVFNATGRYAVPWLVSATSTLTAHGTRMYPGLGLLLIVAMLLDVSSYRRARLADILLPGQRDGSVPARVHEVIGARFTDQPGDRPWAGMGKQAAGAAVSLVYLVVRDLADVVTGAASASGVRAALATAVTVPAAQRTTRALALEAETSGHRRVTIRVAGVVTLVALLLAALVLAPILVRNGAASYLDAQHAFGHGVGHLVGDGNTASFLTDLGRWWNSQPWYVQGAVLVGVAAATVATGGTATAALTATGIAMWGLSHAEGIDTFVHDPSRATQDYLATTSPEQIAADTAEGVLTFLPGAGGLAKVGLRGGRAVADAAMLYRNEPAVFRLLYGTADQGSIALGRSVGSEFPILGDTAKYVYPEGGIWADPTARARWFDDLYSGRLRQAYAGDGRGLYTVTGKNNQTAAYHYQYGKLETGEVRLPAGREAVDADSVHWDPDTVAVIDAKYTGNVARSPYTGTAGLDIVQAKTEADLDDLLQRYAQVIADPDNPIARLRLTTNTLESQRWLYGYARNLLGDDVNLQVVLDP